MAAVRYRVHKALRNYLKGIENGNPNDITRDIEAQYNDIADMKKAHYDANVGQTM